MIKRELPIFLVVGTITVLIDFFTYRGLIRFEIMAVDMAKAISFVIGTLFAYFANRLWTFGHNLHASGSAWRFVVLYTSTLASNVLINSILLRLLCNTFSAIEWAFLLATGISALLNFLGMKFFVFRHPAISELL